MIELINFEPEQIQMWQQMIDDARLNILVMSSSDDSIGIGNLVQFDLADIVKIDAKHEEGYEIQVMEFDGEANNIEYYYAYDYLIL